PVDEPMRRALELCAEHGGRVEESRDGGAAAANGGGSSDDAVGSRRRAVLGAPYLRGTLIAMGVPCEAFQTAVTWGRLPAFHASVKAAAEEAVREACGSGNVFCRFTHVYPDGPAPYFTVIAPARRGAELEQWGAIKRAASDAIAAAGGTITHHH